MIVLGIILLVVAYVLRSAATGIPPAIIELADIAGWILLVVGLILLVLHLIGRPVGRGFGPSVGGRRYWY